MINLATGTTFVPALTLILMSLRGPASKRNAHEEKPRLAEIEPELLRQLIRCMYAGAPPPEALLARAVQAFRSPSTAADEGESFKRLCDRRSALAAAMKFVLFYDNPNNTQAMEQLETPQDAGCAYKRQSPYLCGRLLALLNDIQHRSSTSRRGPNTTLVDKFYAAASTAPQSVFGGLLKQANTAHLPKLRKDSSRSYPVKTNQGEVYVTDLLNEIVNLIDADCGLPKQLAQRQQAEFALGYHHQQAVLRPPYATKLVQTEEDQNNSNS
jgi:CRISPR-associated protein Csd1